MRTRLRQILLGITLVVNLCIGIGFLLTLGVGLKRDLLWKADFSVYYSAGLMIREGHGSQIYDVELEKKYQLRVMDGRSFLGGILPFVYPPHVALIFVPFSFLSRQAGILVWIIGQLLLLIYFVKLLNRVTAVSSRLEYWLIATAIVAYLPLLITITIGAFSLIMLTCLLKIYLCLKERQDVQAGLWFTVGLMKPQLLILPAVMLLAGRRWRSIKVAILGGLAITVLSSLVLGWQIWPTYFQFAGTMTSFVGNFGFDPNKMYNLRGLVSWIAGYDQPALINTISIIGLVGSIVATFYIWRKSWEPEKPDFTLRMALTFLLGILFSLHAYPQEGLQLVGPAVLFYEYLRLQHQPRTVYATVALMFPATILILVILLTKSNFILVPITAMLVLGVWIGRALRKAEVKNAVVQ